MGLDFCFSVVSICSYLLLRSTTALLNESSAVSLGSLSITIGKQKGKMRAKWIKKNTGKIRTAADSVKKWFLKQTYKRGKK